MAFWTEHYEDSVLATAWTCSECHEDTYEASYSGNSDCPPPKFCCHCGVEIIAVANTKKE